MQGIPQDNERGKGLFNLSANAKSTVKTKHERTEYDRKTMSNKKWHISNRKVMMESENDPSTKEVKRKHSCSLIKVKLLFMHRIHSSCAYCR